SIRASGWSRGDEALPDPEGRDRRDDRPPDVSDRGSSAARHSGRFRDADDNVGAIAAAFRPALARHRSARPRPLLSRHARRANVADDRHGGGRDEPYPRPAARNDLRFLSRPHRQRAHAPRRHAVELSGFVAGVDYQRDAWPQRAERDDRHRRRLYPLPGADRARRGASGHADALCRGRARGRRQRLPADRAPRPAERDAADYRPGDDQSRLRHSGGGRPLLPRPRHAAAAVLLGPDDPGLARLSRRGALDRPRPRRSGGADRPWPQHVRRHSPRRLRSSNELTGAGERPWSRSRKSLAGWTAKRRNRWSQSRTSGSNSRLTGESWSPSMT